MSLSEEQIAAQTRERYPLIVECANELREIFGAGVRLIYGVSIDGKSVGKEPSRGHFEKLRKQLESQQQAAVSVGGVGGSSGSGEGFGGERTD